MLCGSVACPLLALTLGRMAGGCGAAATVLEIGCPWKTCNNATIYMTKDSISQSNGVPYYLYTRKPHWILKCKHCKNKIKKGIYTN